MAQKRIKMVQHDILNDRMRRNAGYSEVWRSRFSF